MNHYKCIPALALALTGLTAAALMQSALAQSYPARPVQAIISFPAGIKPQ